MPGQVELGPALDVVDRRWLTPVGHTGGLLESSPLETEGQLS